MSNPSSGSSRNLGPVINTHIHQQLSDQEFLETARSLASVQDEIEKAQADKAKAMKAHNGIIHALETKRAELSETVKTGRRFVQVSARWVMNTPSEGRKTLMHVDAAGNMGAAIRAENMGAEDEQLLSDQS